MTVWKCSQCETPCCFERKVDPYFAPEQCIYKDRGNGMKVAQWKEITLSMIDKPACPDCGKPMEREGV